MVGLITVLVLAMANPTTIGSSSGGCCRIVGMNAQAGVVLARNNANGKTFLFAPKDRNLFAALRVGTSVDFTRRGGISVQGFPRASFKALRNLKGKPPTKVHVEIDCSITPEVCHGGPKPGQNKIDMIGSTTWDDVIDWCWDNPDNCVAGPD